jgi:hypothetical protein
MDNYSLFIFNTDNFKIDLIVISLHKCNDIEYKFSLIPDITGCFYTEIQEMCRLQVEGDGKHQLTDLIP